MDSLIASINEGILMINTQIYALNETLIITLYDMQLNLTRSILLSLKDIKNLTSILLSLVNIFKISIYNAYTNEKLNSDLFIIYVNGTIVHDTTITTIGTTLEVEIRDYWNRSLWENITSERDIKVYLKIGRIIILNEREESLVVLISPENLSDPLMIIIPPLESYDILVYSGSKYNITIILDDTILATGIYGFVERKKREPVILIRISETGIIPFPTRQNNLMVITMSFLSGIGLSALSTGIYRLLISRRLIVRADEVLRHIISNEELRERLTESPRE